MRAGHQARSRSSSSRSSATRSCTTSCSASTRRRSGGAPFALATDRAVRTTAAELGLRAHPGARVYVLPCIAGHVGADTAGVILAEAAAPGRADDARRRRRHERRDRARRRRRLLAASSPTGPAFEGAQISGGQRAAPGAIERVRIDRDDARAALPGHRRRRLVGRARRSPTRPSPRPGVTGICGSGIIEVVAELFLAGDHHRGRRHRRRARGAHAARRRRRPDVQLRPPRGRRVRTAARASPITQNDVRAIQLAKAALYAGVRLLMDQLGIETVDEIRLAGAFGSQIDPLHAMILGLIPDCDLAHVALGRQCGRDRRAHRPAVGRGADRDRGRRPARREDRDRRRAALPGALRRGDGLPAQDGRVPEPGARS